MIDGLGTLLIAAAIVEDKFEGIKICNIEHILNVATLVDFS